MLVPAGAALVGCGEGTKDGKDVEGLLDRAFTRPLKSADVRLDALITVEGLPGFERPVRIQATGPYIGGGGELPKLDVDIKIGAQGAGQTVQSGLLSTGDRAFVKFGGEFYEQSREDVARANRELRRSRGGGRGSLRDLGLDPRRWVVDAKAEGDELVAGVQTRHLSGRLDTRSLFRDLNRLVARSAGAVGGRDPSVPDPLSSDDIDRLAKIVRSPRFDVYVGKRDDVVRRLSAALELRVPEEDRASVGGMKAGSLRFSIELADVNGDQIVEAPEKSRRIGDLTRQLGGLDALGGVGATGAGGAAAGSSAGTRQDDPHGDEGEAAAPREGSADRSEGARGVSAVGRYSDCLDKADPDDTKALSRCAELLR